MARHELRPRGQANLLAGPGVGRGPQAAGERAAALPRGRRRCCPVSRSRCSSPAAWPRGCGKLQEALTGYQQAVELAGPAPRTETVRRAAHASLPRPGSRLRARSWETRPGPASTWRPRSRWTRGTPMALEELIPYFRATGRAAELAEALEKAALVTEEPRRRAALWAEAGELYRGRLSNAEQGRAAARLGAGGGRPTTGSRWRACSRWPRAAATARSSPAASRRWRG